MSTEPDQITTCLSIWTAAERSGDAQALAGVLADDFTAVGPLGFALSRADWLERHETGALRYAAFALEELGLRRYPGVAVATARQTARGTACSSR